MGCGVECGVGCGGRGGVSDSSKLFSPKIYPPKYPKDDDSMFELDGLEILTQKQQKKRIDHRKVFANFLTRPSKASIILNGGSEKTQNYATFKKRS